MSYSTNGTRRPALALPRIEYVWPDGRRETSGAPARAAKSAAPADLATRRRADAQRRATVADTRATLDAARAIAEGLITRGLVRGPHVSQGHAA